MFLLSITSIISGLVKEYGYIGLFALMVLESASLPVPSEVVLPVAGLLVAKNLMNAYVALAAALAGGMVGIAIDYYIAYFLGKEVVYKHLGLFHIDRKRLDDFDRWFEKNGPFAVFIMRLLPVLRGLVSFPAGFAGMSKKKFFAYSLVGSVIWDVVLMEFGYYALSISNSYRILAYIAGLGILLYAIYAIAMKKIRKKS